MIADKIIAFRYNQNGGVYSSRTIALQVREIDITQKVSSTEAYQIFTPDNQLKMELFWNQGPPVGVAGNPSRQLTDIDKFGIRA